MAIYDGWLLGNGKLLNITERIALTGAAQGRAGLDLAYKPKDWKLNNKSTLLLPELVQNDGLSVGDEVLFKEGWTLYLWGLDPYEEADVPELPLNLPYVLLSFVQLVGGFKHSRTQIAAMGCILAPANNSQWHDLTRLGFDQLFCPTNPIVSLKSNKVLVFWAKTLRLATA